MHPKIPQVPFAGCTVDTIRLLPTMSRGNKYTLTFMCLLTSYLITVPLKSKTTEEVTMAYIKHILPATSCSTFILRENGTEFKNSHLVTTFISLGIKPIYSNPYRPQGNSRLENAHNFLKHTISSSSIVAHWNGMTSYQLLPTFIILHQLLMTSSHHSS